VSEDPAHHGNNLYSYASNEPHLKIDKNGKWPEWVPGAILYGSFAGWIASAFASPIAFGCFIAHAAFMLAWFALDGPLSQEREQNCQITLGFSLMTGAMAGIWAGAVMSVSAGEWILGSLSPAGHVLAVLVEHAAFLGLFMTLELEVEGCMK
jgi:hypothetical protein